jgi:hypothetical protein
MVWDNREFKEKESEAGKTCSTAIIEASGFSEH